MNYSPLSIGFHAWLSPTGEVFRVEYMEHDEWAYSFLKEAPHDLEKKGWIKICGNLLNYYGFSCKLTEYQKIKLVDFGYVINDEEEFEYWEPEALDWYDHIPYAKGSNSYVV